MQIFPKKTSSKDSDAGQEQNVNSYAVYVSLAGRALSCRKSETASEK